MGKFKELAIEEEENMYKNILQVKVKKLHKDAVIPKKANPSDAGLDLTAIRAERPSVDKNGMVYTLRYHQDMLA